MWCPGFFVPQRQPPTKGDTLAIQLEANYSKKLGLPGYSSHQYSVTIRLELGDIKQVEAESTRLYALLQDCVDRDLQQSGFLPANGNTTQHNGTNGTNGNNGHTNGHSPNGNGHSNGNGRAAVPAEVWSCSDKQRSLIGTAYTPPYGIEGLGLGAAGLWRGCSGSGSAGSAEGAVQI